MNLVISPSWSGMNCGGGLGGRRKPFGPLSFDDDLPNVNRLVAKIIARNDGEPGYAAAVAGGIAAKLATDARP